MITNFNFELKKLSDKFNKKLNKDINLQMKRIALIWLVYEYQWYIKIRILCY